MRLIESTHLSVIARASLMPGGLPQVPRHAASALRVGVVPGDGVLVAGVHAGAALDAVFELEMDVTAFIQRVAVGGAHVGGTLVRARCVADRRIDEDVWFGFTAALVAIGHLPQTLGNAQCFHNSPRWLCIAYNDVAPLKPNLMRSQ